MPKSIILRVLALSLLFASMLYGTALATYSGPEPKFNRVASPSAGYALTWSTIGGGGLAAGGSYMATGTIGQPEAVAGLSGGSYSLNGGFWNVVQSGANLFLPLLRR